MNLWAEESKKPTPYKKGVGFKNLFVYFRDRTKYKTIVETRLTKPVK